MNQKGFTIILIIIIFILVGVIGYFTLVRVQKQETPLISQTPPPITKELTTETITTIKETVSNFLKAKQRRNFDEAKLYLTPEFAATIDPIDFVGTANPHTGRFEFQDTVQFSSSAKTYRLQVRVYQEYTGKGDIGYNDDTFFVKQVGGKYLISNIEYGQYIPLQ